MATRAQEFEEWIRKKREEQAADHPDDYLTNSEGPLTALLKKESFDCGDAATLTTIIKRRGIAIRAIRAQEA